MTRRAISTGSSFEALAGYSRAIVDGEWIFVSGTAGYDFKAGTIADDAAVQTQQALHTIEGALAQARADLGDIVRVRVYTAERSDIAAVSRVLAETFRDPRPTNTTIVCGFAQLEMKVKLEVTALRRRRTLSTKSRRAADPTDSPQNPSSSPGTQ